MNQLMCKEFSIENMSVWKINHTTWIAAPNIINAIKEYYLNIPHADNIHSITLCDSNVKTVWSSEIITPFERKSFYLNPQEFLQQARKRGINYGLFNGQLNRWVSFGEIINCVGVGAYVLKHITRTKMTMNHFNHLLLEQLESTREIYVK